MEDDIVGRLGGHSTDETAQDNTMRHDSELGETRRGRHGGNETSSEHYHMRKHTRDGSSDRRTRTRVGQRRCSVCGRITVEGQEKSRSRNGIESGDKKIEVTHLSTEQ